MRLVNVTASRSYEVKIGSKLLDTLGQEAAKLTGGKVLVVTDETVALSASNMPITLLILIF